MKKIFALILLFVFILAVMLTGCRDNMTTANTEESSSSDNLTDNSTNDPNDNIINIDTEELPFTQEEIYAQLFDINNKIEIDVDISEETLKQLQDDYDEYTSFGSKSPIYRKADMDITITTKEDTYVYHIEDIGIRMKGNTSRKSFYNSKEGVYNLINFKVDFQETFDDEKYYSWDATDWSGNEEGRDVRKNRTFATLEKLEFKWNKNDDGTYIREYYTYEFYRDSGVLAPHTNLTSFEFGGLHQGVFMMYEPIDKIFIEKYVPVEDQGGDLYKCGWTHIGAGFFRDCSVGIEDEDSASFYNYDLKTNKKTSTHGTLNNLIAVVNGNKVTKEQLEKVIDIDNFLLFEAVSYFVGNPDDLRNNYNNYYIYFKASDNKMIFIPYDLDRCFGITHDWNPTGDALMSVGPFSDQASGAQENQANPIYRKTVSEGGMYIEEFAEVLDTISKSKWLTEENFNSYYEIAYNNYKDDAMPDKVYHNTEGHGSKFDKDAEIGGNVTFANYISAKLATYNTYADNKDEYISAVQPFFIRGSFTDWQIENKYRMSYDKDTNTYQYTLILKSNSPWKVNNGVDGGAGEWFGCEDIIEIPEGLEVYADQDDNINLPAGTYEITFYGDTWQIKIE